MRNISFSLTTQQIKDRSKTVTRRLGWKDLKVGTILRACRKCMGLRPHEEIERLATIRVTAISREPLHKIDKEDCVREGFPDLTPQGFIEMFCSHMGGNENQIVTRIEFEYVNPVTYKPER